LDEWLRSIGLARRLAAFREHGITLDQLGDLTEADLAELGLTIGERVRFRRASAAQQAGQPGATTPGVTIVPQVTRAERRPLTVMFVDLVDSTALGERLDPEDLIEVIRDYRELCGNAIARYGGNIARFVGDGVLAYFCYPVANENDPERAVRAALDIIRGIGSVDSPDKAPVQVRIGLATGPVIIGDLFAGGEADPRTIIGSTPNLAARLQSLAGPNEVILAEHTHARVRSRFVSESIGAVQLKGFDQTQEPWRVISEAAPESRLGTASRPHRLTSFHGREHELDVIRAQWNRAARGDGNVVLVVGEPGIGKSRLLENFWDGSLVDGTRVVYLAASAFDEHSPLRPFSDYLHTAAGLDFNDAPSVGLAKLKAALVGDPGQLIGSLSVLAGLVGIAIGESAVAQLPPEQLRRRTISALIDQLVGLAGEKPLCLIIEDLHWLDATSRELLDLMVERVRGHRVLLLLTARESFTADWTQRPETTVLRLERLRRGDVAAMIGDLLAETIVPPWLVRQVVYRTDGVPLFVEEVGRVLLQRHDLSGLSERPLDEPQQVVPASLAESLIARLDRSGIAKGVAQAAAVLGRSVRRDVLAGVVGLTCGDLEQPLSMLVEAGVLERDVRTDVESFTFSHALLRDAAYSTLLRDQRKDLHAGLIFRGWVVATQRDPTAGLSILEEGFARQREIATTEDFPVYLCLLAEALTAVGKPGEAAERIARERPEFDRIRLRVWIPELLRAQGEAILAADPASLTQARTLFVEAAELAEMQGVPMLGLRIAVSEARLDQRLGALDEAARRLDDALRRPIENDGSTDLVAAQELAGQIRLKSAAQP
jgi:class 3 adenylate cyclase